MRILENRRGSTVLQAVFEKIKNLFTLIYVANISIIKHVTNCHRSVTLIPGTVFKSENEIIPRSLVFCGPFVLLPVREFLIILLIQGYPPNELSSTVLGLPEWIKAGLSGAEYICEEKGATFSA